jgi:uncharacterized RDD family membrane protein YckC
MRDILSKIVLIVGGLLVALRIFYPPLYIKFPNGMQMPYTKYFSDRGFYPIADYQTALLHALGIVIITGIVYYLVRQFPVQKTKEGTKEEKETITPEIPKEIISSPKELHVLKSNAWKRFWARWIDFAIFLFLYEIILIFLNIVLHFSFSPLRLSSQNPLLNYFLISTLQTLMFIIGFVIFESFLLWGFATTPGKALFKIYVKDSEGNNLTYKQAMKRTVSVLWNGLGFLLFFPGFSLAMMWLSYKYFKANGITKWDKLGGYFVQQDEISSERKIVGMIIAIICLLFVSTIFISSQSMLKEQEEKIKWYNGEWKELTDEELKEYNRLYK